MSDVFTSWQKITRGAPNNLGWRSLEVEEGEEHRGEDEAGQVAVDEGKALPMLVQVHLFLL